MLYQQEKKKEREQENEIISTSTTIPETIPVIQKNNKNDHKKSLVNVFGLKPHCFLCGIHDRKLTAITVGNINETFSPFAHWYCYECIPEEAITDGNQMCTDKTKRKSSFMDYSTSTKTTQQKKKENI